eukprot:maker-scaffold_3-snap-gene-8.45-mRNA-1 protein AED:0.26 eAED:0.26 QI:34/1/1/1/1/1/2/99/325
MNTTPVEEEIAPAPLDGVHMTDEREIQELSANIDDIAFSEVQFSEKTQSEETKRRPRKSMTERMQSFRTHVSDSVANLKELDILEKIDDRYEDIKYDYNELTQKQKLRYAFCTLLFLSMLIIIIVLGTMVADEEEEESQTQVQTEPIFFPGEFAAQQHETGVIEFGDPSNGDFYQVRDPENSNIRLLISCLETPISCLTVVYESGHSQTIGRCETCEFSTDEASSIYDYQDPPAIAFLAAVVSTDSNAVNQIGFSFVDGRTDFFQTGVQDGELVILINDSEANTGQNDLKLKGFFGHESETINSIGFVLAPRDESDETEEEEVTD